ncbi:hypothetical protein C5S29_05660 [ANME-1 cluster archaeon GoMg3.2]|jgi:hypothetical protein|nr:hypothetical protein [ANME-1 cluster archaeon GoMg3.2]
MDTYKVSYVTDINSTEGSLILSDSHIVFTTDGRLSDTTKKVFESILSNLLQVNGSGVYTFDGGEMHLVFPYDEITHYEIARGPFLSLFRKGLVIEHSGAKYYFGFYLMSEGSPEDVKQILDEIYRN